MLNDRGEGIVIHPDELRDYIRACELIAVASIQVRAGLLNEILMFTPLMAFNSEIKRVDAVESISINGECIQLNLGKCPHAE